jgi:hypothetical protein
MERSDRSIAAARVFVLEKGWTCVGAIDFDFYCIAVSYNRFALSSTTMRGLLRVLKQRKG